MENRKNQGFTEFAFEWNRENNTIHILINKYVLLYICVKAKQTTGGVYGL